ncbi:glycoside hydrolase family 125 protein [Terrimonas sp. NA20]|uniref:Glycoside hydrolase family 125 protein n=1 Tax=Terrimonas ginsenosidimutans TaxID=2908004 RepID=A0ABS9KSL2_9BACT|nr:glycoside hydrolase family 125 protein [Terrimonas ginsenosidimutans]MCG2615320.1 glycoside hydrolase family 125 protein [Terrimonas ginsenosidimutans]
MTTRKTFIQQMGLLTTVAVAQPSKLWAASNEFESKRPPLAQRHFTSEAVEAMIKKIKSGISNPELGWLFENCFPNTLDTTVDFSVQNGKPDTYVITGDIDAMWLRDSTAQVWPYLPLMKTDPKLQQLVAGVINRQVKNIHLDPYTNAFYKDGSQVSEWKHTDITDMKPGVHERKWEIDSLCYPIRLAYHYWKITGDTIPFDAAWKESIVLTVKTFKEQQRKDGNGPYTFQRTTFWATDGVPLSGYGYPVKPVGLICSIFRPSDDATIFPFLIPSNFFAVVSLKQAAEMLNAIHKDQALAKECTALAQEVSAALKQYATATHPKFGKIYAFEVNGYGSFNLMDDANVPSLLSMPYLGSVNSSDPVYQNTRRYVWSSENPFFFKGSAGEGIGGPHAGMDMIWPMSIIMRGLTTTNPAEIKQCITWLQATHGGTGFMHESFHKNDPAKFTRKWFAWANTLFGELIMNVYQKHPQLLNK